MGSQLAAKTAVIEIAANHKSNRAGFARSGHLRSRNIILISNASRILSDVFVVEIRDLNFFSILLCFAQPKKPIEQQQSPVLRSIQESE